MKKTLIALIFAILLVACKSKEAPNLEAYPLSKIKSYTYDESLYTRTRIIDYPSNIKGKSSYDKKDLANLDYNKEVRLGDLFFRIPEKGQIFKNDNIYYIDFPTSPAYDLVISFEDLSDFYDYDLIDLSNKIIKEKNLSQKIKSLPIKNIMTNLDSAYFISKDENKTSTHFFIKGDSSLVYFVIREDTSKSNASAAIMADILMTAYNMSDDPFEINKSFKDHKDALSVFATKEVLIDKQKIKIPENFYLHQDDDKLKSFIAKDKNEVIAEIIIKEDKITGDIYQAYSQNSGQILYPAQIVNMGKINKYKNILEGDVRIYLQNDTLTGKKYLIKTKDSYISLIVAGPLANESLVKSMAESIKSSIK